MSKAQDTERARRLAHTIASELAIYHSALFDEGVRTDTLFDLARAPLESGRAMYASRILPRLDPQQQLYWQAVIDVILYPRSRLSSVLW